MFKDFDEKYEAKTLDDIVFQSDIGRETIEDCVSGICGFPASGVNGILLWGTNGTGKTALAKILPDLIEMARIGRESMDVSFYRISQGGENGANVIENIKKQAVLIPFGKYRYFIMDEVDNLLPASMNSLKVAMNIGAMHCVFILTTNCLPKIERGIVDRCIKVQFNAANETMWLPLFRKILSDYDVTGVTDENAMAVIKLCNGSARQILSAARNLVVKHYRKHGKPLTLAA
jgi:DNA polymerase III gamma/tau subunit